MYAVASVREQFPAIIAHSHLKLAVMRAKLFHIRDGGLMIWIDAATYMAIISSTTKERMSVG
jgi:hypothetical protein